ncbi:glycosyltransferase [Paenibacillus alvei]|uniref:glycosyltransferase n=1 Tax=Paenibacillus alvei TaxID=44250 RepID=UPI001F50C2AD|nr:glycosyltransferase [Paenibacillus alvei]
MKLVQSEEGKQMLSGNPLRSMKLMKTHVFPMMRQMLEDVWEASQDADAIIYHPKVFGGYDIAQKRKIPAFIAHPTSIIVPTGTFTNPILPFTLRIRWLNKISYQLNRLMILSFIRMINKWRRETLNLPPRSLSKNELCIDGRDIPVLYGCSPTVVPYDPKWKDRVCMEGSWFASEMDEWHPSQSLESFISAGTPPIAISFSSMPLKQPDQVFGMIRKALNQTGQRGIIITGWSGLKQNLDSCGEILCIDEVPHAWLFPWTAGVIHHGGAGTTAAVLHAGKPMAICPFTGDQPFWARRMYELGVSPKPLHEKTLSIESLVECIVSLTNDSKLKHNAMIISSKVKNEQGVERTVDFIEKHLAASRLS